jgi:hypothetical protein
LAGADPDHGSDFGFAASFAGSPAAAPWPDSHTLERSHAPTKAVTEHRMFVLLHFLDRAFLDDPAAPRRARWHVRLIREA